MSTETNDLESKICPYCGKSSLKIFTDMTGYRWVMCLIDSDCKFEAFLDHGTPSPEGLQFMKDMESSK